MRNLLTTGLIVATAAAACLPQAHADILIELTGGFGNFTTVPPSAPTGSGAIAGQVQFDPALGEGALVTSANVVTTDGEFIVGSTASSTFLGGATYLLGQNSPAVPGDNLALVPQPEPFERLLFLDFGLPFGPDAGFTAGPNLIFVTEFICVTSNCTAFDEDTSTFRRGIAEYRVTDVVPVPEPSAIALFALAAGFALRRSRVPG